MNLHTHTWRRDVQHRFELRISYHRGEGVDVNIVEASFETTLFDRYYGELDFTMHYKGEFTEVFPWLYLDEAIFETACQAAGLHFEVVTRGENYDYLARLSGRD